MSKSLYTTIKDTTPPTTATVGIVGQKYLDTTTKKYYICTNIDNGVYTWEELAKSNDLDSKLNTSGGTISGNLAVQGNLTVTGETTTEKQKDLEVEDNFIYTNANKVELTALLSGIAIYKNGTDIYAIAYDPATDSVKLGLGTRDTQGVFHFNTGEGSPVAVRADSANFTDNHIIIWDATNHKFIDSGKTIADLDNRDIGVELNVPNTATNGTLTESQLQILQSNNSNYIILDHEIYKIGGSGHKAGYLTYNCDEYENSDAVAKFITITISTRGWVLNTVPILLRKDIVNFIYPVGAIFISHDMNLDPNISYPGTTWRLLPRGYTLWTASTNQEFDIVIPNQDTYIDAGLPDITGTLEEAILRKGKFSKSGVFNDTTRLGDYWDSNKGDSFQGDRYQIDFKASSSNSIYGSSTTVQPPAIKVNIWQRTA